MNIGNFDADLRPLAWFDPTALPGGWFDFGLPFSHALIGLPFSPLVFFHRQQQGAA